MRDNVLSAKEILKELVGKMTEAEAQVYLEELKKLSSRQ
ncbi:Transcriptional regulator [Phaeobacter inhibens]|nr:hypothetical protein OL67_000678 [Phaeobacter piscinae]